MSPVCANQSNPEKTSTDEEGNNEKRTHIHLPTPGDWACGSENDPSPAFVKFGVQPRQIGDEYLGLKEKMRKVNTTIICFASCGLVRTFSLPESYTTRISNS